ncbi:MAG: hypothetical protein ABII88_03510 [Candidatus Omnitrophota bacterium]
MRSVHRKSIVFYFALFLLLSANIPGYCLFRDDVDPQQAASRVKMQREKDAQKKREYEEKKQEEESRAKRDKVNQDEVGFSQTSGSGQTNTKTSSAGQASAAQPQKGQESFKRLNREEDGSTVVRQDKGQQQKSGKSEPGEEKKGGVNPVGFAVMLIIIAGLWLFIEKRFK